VKNTKPTRKAAITVLLVGEGATEKAFLDHLKSLYVTRGCGVSVAIRDAHGKGPDNVVNFAIRQSKVAAYDVRAVLMDTDLEWNASIRKAARNSRICLIGSTPCCDGLMLSILGLHVPAASDQCKEAIVRRLQTRPLTPEAFSKDFPKELIEAKRETCRTTQKIVAVLLGSQPESD
jgi:hypothetical protein